MVLDAIDISVEGIFVFGVDDFDEVFEFLTDFAHLTGGVGIEKYFA